ncbi:unnamed protein product [Calypogeia fissa]
MVVDSQKVGNTSIDGGMEEVDKDHNRMGQDEKATLQRDISVCRWDAGIGMGEIMVKKGKVWGSMGVIRNSKLYCHVEEAVYMVEQGSLLLLRDDGVATLRQEVYDLLAVPSNGCSWDAYQIFCHLKRLGYIVGRHGTPWSTSKAKRPPRETIPGFESKEDSDLKEEIPSSANSSSKSSEMSVDNDINGQGSLPTVLEVAQTELSRDVVDCQDADEESLKHDRNENKDDDETSLSQCEELCVEEDRKGLPFLLSNLQLSDEDMALNSRDEDNNLNLMFDVHHPNGRFKKTAPGFPAFTLCVVKGQEPPEQRQVRTLEAKIGGRPLKFGTVDCGHVSIFSFTSCDLPTLP